MHLHLYIYNNLYVYFISQRSFEVYLRSAFFLDLAFNLAGLIPMGSAPSVTTESVGKRRSVRGASRTSANGGAVAFFFDIFFFDAHR